MLRTRIQPGLAIAILLAALMLPKAQAVILIPDGTTQAFIQTSGRLAPLTFGDYRSNILGDDLPHEIDINVACLPTHTFNFELFDPAIDVNGNPGVAAPPNPPYAHGTPEVIDEPRDAANNVTANPSFFDNSHFQLYNPNSALLTDVTYTPGSFDADWTLLFSTTMPANPVRGVDCGRFVLVDSTGTGGNSVQFNNDDNSWRFQLRGFTPGGVEFDPGLGPLGIQGTGDESWIGRRETSYQHLPGGACNSANPNSQDFFWFVDVGLLDMYMINFDLDVYSSNGLGSTIRYETPSGVVITGTPSGESTWNNAIPQANQMQARPVFSDMALFDPITGDVSGDAINNPEPGLWKATICSGSENQYSFDVPGRTVFLQPPELPDVQFGKDDFRTDVNSPDQTTYTIVITNMGMGGALPVAGPEVVDTLPAGMSFVSCGVNPPLIGTCSNTGGSDILFELGSQSVTTLAFLPGVAAAPLNSGSLTVTANIAAGLPDGLLLTNRSFVRWLDIYGNTAAPPEATDTNTVVIQPPPPMPTQTPIPPDIPVVLPPTTIGSDGNPPIFTGGNSPYISKRVEPPFALPGDTIVWSITVTNPGDEPLTNVIAEDRLPDALEIVSISASSGTVTRFGQLVRLTQSVLGPHQSATVEITARVSENAPIPFIIRNLSCVLTNELSDPACSQSSVISVTSLPITGESHWSKWRLPIFAGATLLTLAVLILLSYQGFVVFRTPHDK